MKDAVFIKAMLQKGKEAGDKVRTSFTGISLEQLNWKPAPESWSIGQCLDHLIVSDCLYYPALKEITEGKFIMTSWQRWNPLSGLIGRILVQQLQEDAKRKIKAPKVFTPAASQLDAGILERFHKHLDSLLEYFAGLEKVDIDRTHITSPISGFVTYSLRNAVTILVQHEHRHINQALRVKGNQNFPK